MGRFTIFLLALFQFHAVMSQHPGGTVTGGQQVQKSIQGFLIDSLTQKPIPYASVALYRMRDTSLVGGAITDDKGYFRINGVSFGRYMVRITFVGYRPVERSPIMVTPQSPDPVDLGRLQITFRSSDLPEVVIEGTRPYIEMNLEKKVVNVEQDVSVTGGTALDVLQTIPSVSVDMDGNVSYRGSQNVTILIDGRPAHFAGSRKAMLEQIPASSIQSIELISNPSAKYDPEGTAGIINIVLKQRKSQNFSSQLNTNLNSLLGYSGGGMISFGSSKTNVTIGIDHRYDVRPGSGRSERYNFITEPYYILQNITSFSNSTGNSGRFNIDYFPISGLTLGLNANVNQWNSFGTTESKVEEKNSMMQFRRNYQNNNENNNKHLMFQGGMNVMKKFAKPGHQIQLDMNYSQGNFDAMNNQLRSFYDEDWMLIDSLIDLLDVHNSWSRNSTFAGKLDYTLPLNDSTKLESGIHLTMRSMHSDNKYYKGLVNQEFLPFDSLRSNVFDFSERIYATYAIFTSRHKKITFSGGIRYEFVETEPSLKGDTNRYYRTYHSIYPSGSVTYNISRGQDLQLSYSKRVNRPSFHSLSPFIDYSDAPNLRGGNPYLKPEYIHSVELSYMRMFQKGSVIPSVFYKHTVNLISRYRQNYLDTFSLVTFLNLARANTYGFELVLNYNPLKFIRLSGSGNVARTHLNANNIEADLNQEGFLYGGSVMGTVVIRKKLDVQLSSFYRSGNVLIQGRRSGMFSVNTGLRYKILNDKLIASLNVRDIFNTMGFKVFMEDPTFRFNMERKWASRVVTLGLVWQINPERMPRDRERRRSRDDVSSDDDMF